jgi:hypothetical protein
MLIVVPILTVLFLVAASALRDKEMPLDRDVVLRIRRFADDLRREELLPYE